MFGCFKFIISGIFSIIVGIALILFYFFGGFDYVKSMFEAQKAKPILTVEQQAQKFADFSHMPKDYKLKKSVGILGVNAILAEHKQTKQKMAIVDTGWIFNLSKDDILSNKLDDKLKELSSKYNNKVVAIDNFEIGKKGMFNALNQNIPYVKIKLKTSGQLKNDFEGIIGVVNKPDNKNNLVVSFSDTGKYKQKTAEKFFQNLKFNKN